MASGDQILLTGVTGFIAKHIALNLLEAGYAVRGSLRTPSRAEEVRNALAGHLSDASALDRLTFVELDLTDDAGWPEAVAGVDALVHTASPFPIIQPKDESELIEPAVSGTLRAMRAAKSAGVERIVLTSSVVAAMWTKTASGRAISEADWTDTSHPAASAYVKSKTLAEEAAWDFVAESPETLLTTINPGLVIGRPLDKNYGSSLELIERIFAAKDPMLPDVGFPGVDVKDVAAMHLKALEDPSTAGKRYLATTSWVTMRDVAETLQHAYPDRKIAKRQAPKLLLQFLSLFDPSIRTILPALGIHLTIDNTRAREDMGMEFTPVEEALLESARAIEAG
ncbi:MAG: NAD-dependent epimerase/dehydratase family protein [Pseudomonadota bacterium]